jgi:aryl-alcohol dehydrogenase-like predicted oxidoreductase
MRDEIGLLPYSPLGYGVLGGRYFDGSTPKGSRPDVHPQFALRYRGPIGVETARLYDALAKKHGLTLPTMALAFVHRQPFVASTIIGASNEKQLLEDIASIDVTLSDDVLSGINEIHEQHPNVVA